MGPIFFIVYINNLPKNLNIHSVLYADDTPSLESRKNPNALQETAHHAEVNADGSPHINKLSRNPTVESLRVLNI